MLPEGIHVDDSLARGFARQLVREAIKDIERREARFVQRLKRITSLPRQPGKRLKMLTRLFVDLLGESVIGVITPSRKRESINLIVFLSYRKNLQNPGTPPIVEVFYMPITAYPGSFDFLHTGVRISQHVLERIIQRNRARSLKDILHELEPAVMAMALQGLQGPADTRLYPETGTFWMPSPHGILLGGDEGIQPYDSIQLHTLITFVHSSQMTQEQLENWHHRLSLLPTELAAQYPDNP